MSGVYTGWFDGWQNARQRQAIRELSGEISSLSSSLVRQARESNRLRSQLAQLQGTLEQRVSRLTESLQALVELTDIRGVLAMFDPPALVRHRAREVITELCEPAGSGPDLPPMPDDVPGYWLAPAVRALVALAGDRDATEPLTAAQQRDRRRTALLLTCGLALAGRSELAQRWLPDAFGPLSADAQVTEAQRTLWTLAAAGRFGSVGEQLLRQRLADLVSGLTPDQAAAEEKAWLAQAEQLADQPRLPAAVRDNIAARRALVAGARLTALRGLVAPDPAAGAGSGPAPASSPAVGGTALTAADRGQLTAVVHSLVDEGTLEEAPLLRRAAELRAIIETGQPGTEPPTQWDSPAGDACELLRGDAFRRSSPELAEPARRAGARWLVAAARQLAEQASVRPPTELTVDAGAGEKIRVFPTGPDSWDLARVRNRLEQRPVIDPRADRITRILAIAGGVLVLPVIGWPNGLAVLSVLAGFGLLIAAGARWVQERQRRAYRVAEKRAAIANVDKQVTKVAGELAEVRQAVTAARDTASADLAAIKTKFGG